MIRKVLCIGVRYESFKPILVSGIKKGRKNKYSDSSYLKGVGNGLALSGIFSILKLDFRHKDKIFSIDINKIFYEKLGITIKNNIANKIKATMPKYIKIDKMDIIPQDIDAWVDRVIILLNK
ncbi:MAG: hypothetical protein WCO84_02765 [bacterium]